jgi:glutamate formiminotransferase
VPNFSEGRDRATIDAIGAALSAHARLLDVHRDVDHNRSVFTVVGEDGPIVDALVAAAELARERIDPAVGGVMVGARRPLIAFNVNLRGSLEAAKEIADAVRERTGGFPGVRALGLELPEAGHVQVSMNVEDWEAAALHEIVERIADEAGRRGTEVTGSELVGLMPAGAAAAAAGAMLRIDGFDASRVLELRLLGE